MMFTSRCYRHRTSARFEQLEQAEWVDGSAKHHWKSTRCALRRVNQQNTHRQCHMPQMVLNAVNQHAYSLRRGPRTLLSTLLFNRYQNNETASPMDMQYAAIHKTLDVPTFGEGLFADPPTALTNRKTPGQRR